MILGGNTKFCRWCGSAYTPTAPQQIYCSQTCERDAYKSRGGGPTPIQPPGMLMEPEWRRCKRCGKLYLTTHEGRRYCSDKCRYHGDVVLAEMERDVIMQEMHQKEAVP